MLFFKKGQDIQVIEPLFMRAPMRACPIHNDFLYILLRSSITFLYCIYRCS